MSDSAVRDALVAALSARYQLDPDVYATGGMALIYGARDLRHGRRVAIKVMRPEQAAVFGADRFIREINLTANLQHPHILPLLDSGTVDVRGVTIPYYVMPLVIGRSLRAMLDRGDPLPLDQTLAIVRDVADGLQHAHDRGLIHRDIKPENILLNESGAALIADFGVARAIGPTAPGLTEQGATVGTPTYMSPEQLFDATALGGATDQYSLAAVCYELLAGRPPFQAATRDQLVARRLTEPHPALSQLRPDLPAPLARAVERGLARKPDDRFPSVHSFAAALRESAAPAPATKPPTPRRRRLLLGLVGALGIVGTLAAWWAGRPARVVAGGAMVVLADVENLTTDSTLGPALRVAASVGLAQSSTLSLYSRARLAQSLARMGRPATDTVLSEPLAREIAYREGGQAVISLTVTEVGGVHSLAARLVDPVTGAVLAAKRIAAGPPENLLAATDRLVSWTRKNLGDPNARQGRPLPLVTTSSLAALQTYAEARAAVGRGQWPRTRRLAERAIELDTGFAMAQGFLGEYLIFMNDIPGGLKWLREANRRAERLTEPERLNVAMLLAGAEGRTRDRIDLAGDLATRFPSSGNWHAYGEALRLSRRYQEAVAALERARALDTSRLSIQYDLAVALRNNGDRRGALDLFNHIDAVDSTFLLRVFATLEWGRVYVDQDDLLPAEAIFRRLLNQPEPADRARGHRLLAFLSLYQGRFAEAADHLRQGIPLWTGSLSEFRDQVLLADAELSRGNTTAAHRALDRVHAIFTKIDIQAAALMFAGHQFIRAGQLARGQLFLDSLRARAALRPNARQDQEALAILTADLRLAQGQLAAAEAALEKTTLDDYPALSLSLRAEAHAARGRRDSALVYAKRATEARIFGLETQQNWLRSFGQLARAAEAAGDSATARNAYSQLLERWRRADPDLPQLVLARRELVRLQTAATR